MVMKTKICANPSCNSSFEYKNPKKRFCCLYCKNQAAYLYKLENYAWEVTMQKARLKNIQVLEYLLNKKTFKISDEELKKMGFDFCAAHIPHKDEQKRFVYRYGNIGLRLISGTDLELFQINK